MPTLQIRAQPASGADSMGASQNTGLYEGLPSPASSRQVVLRLHGTEGTGPTLPPSAALRFAPPACADPVLTPPGQHHPPRPQAWGGRCSCQPARRKLPSTNAQHGTLQRADDRVSHNGRAPREAQPSSGA